MRNVVDLTALDDDDSDGAAPRVKRRRERTDIVDVDEEPEVLPRAPPRPPPVAALPHRHTPPTPACRFGARCNRQDTCRFRHDAALPPGRGALGRDGMPRYTDYSHLRGMFGADPLRWQHFLQQQRALAEREERDTRRAMEQSMADEVVANAKRAERSDQDREYLEGLEADRRAQHAREEAERVQRETHELAVARQASLAALFAGDPPTEDAVVVTLHLPDGKRVSRAFGLSEPGAMVFTYTDYLRGTPEGASVPAAFALVQLMPKVALAPDVALGDAGLGRARMLLYVIEDEEEGEEKK